MCEILFALALTSLRSLLNLDLASFRNAAGAVGLFLLPWSVELMERYSYGRKPCLLISANINISV